MDVDSLSLAYAYGCRNAGDFAINQGSLALLDRALPDAKVTAISRFPTGSAEFEEMARKLDGLVAGETLLGGPIRYDPRSQSRPAQLRALAGTGVRYGLDLSGLGDAGALHSTLYEQIAATDALLFNGGNAIHYSPSHRSLPYLLAVLYPLHVARRTGTPYGILPQTTFGLTGLGRRLVRPVLNDAEFVMTRDAATFRSLSALGLETPVVNGVDTAFLNGTPTATAGSSGPSKRIAAVPRFSTLGDTGDLDETGQAMERTYLEYLEALVDDGHEVTLTVQTEIDEEWAAANRDRLDRIGVESVSAFDPQSLRDHYAEMDLLVTMRLHAAIFALSVGTPTVGLYRPEWGPKMPGTFETLDIAEYALTWSEADLGTLRSLTDDALERRSSLSAHVADAVEMRNRQLVSDFGTMMRAIGDD